MVFFFITFIVFLSDSNQNHPFFELFFIRKQDVSQSLDKEVYIYSLFLNILEENPL